jgi:hypothetical protein
MHMHNGALPVRLCAGVRLRDECLGLLAAGASLMQSTPSRAMPGNVPANLGFAEPAT